MRLVACVGLMALCLASAGCGLFGKKSPNAAPRPPSGEGQPGGQGQGNGGGAAAPQPGLGGILAGQVIDGFGRKPPPAYIQVVMIEAPKEAGAAPISVKLDPVAADPNGYFTIQKLQPGKHYQLIARAQEGGRKLAGMTFATPPDPKVVIKISEDFAGKDIPDVPPPPGWQGQQRAGNPGPNDKKSPPAFIDRPIPVPGGQEQPGWRGAAELGQPIQGGAPPVPPPAQTPPGPPRLDSMVKDQEKDIAKVPDSPKAEMPHQGPMPRLPDFGRKTEDPPAVNTNPAPVPSCQLVGRTLHNFALNDIDGKPWEFRKDRKGRLVLLDFWGTWCGYCVQGIPELKILQENYGPYGLEVISIAYERGPASDHARKVRGLASRMNTNYRLLLGTGLDVECPVRRQFEVASFPTLFLLDERGQIVWQSRDGLGQPQLAELKFEIKKHLGLR